MSIIVVNRETREIRSTYKFSSKAVAMTARIQIMAKWIRQRRESVLISSIIIG